MKDKSESKVNLDFSAEAVMSQPESAEELLLKYGTYEIQSTADSDNEFPKIAQGIPKKQKNYSKKYDETP